MKLRIYITLFAALFTCAFAADATDAECVDGSCTLPGIVKDGQNGSYAVLSPIGPGTIQKITQAPRLDTLDGKKIAIVGGSFMASVTHPELRRLILSQYPSAKIYLLSEIGAAGPWPAPGVIRHEKDEFQRKLKEYGIQAVISGNGGCGLCTPKETGSCIAAEHIGIPSVMIAAPGFVEQARSAATAAGVPIQRVAEYPGAFASHTRDELRNNTRNILWPQILKALTTPFTEEEIKASQSVTNDNNGVVFTGTYDEVNHYFAEMGWTDGLPIVPPTEERVAQFLKFTDKRPDDVVAELPVAFRKTTVRHVAVNGVMSGCPAEFMPILIAFTQAMGYGEFRKTLASTHAWTPFCWLNGPLARQLGIDCAQGEISTQKNARIGRFINLAMLNLGGYYVKENRMGTFGYLMPWCLAEDEKAAINLGWRPWNMQQGYGLNVNTLTAASALSWGNNLAPATSDAKKIMEMMAWDAVEKEQFAVGSGTPFVYRTMLVTEYVARDLATTYKSKTALEKALVETARRPLEERAYANYWGNPGSAFNPSTYSVQQHAKRIGDNEGSSVTKTPPWLAWSGKETIETVPVMQEGKTAILITGDANRNKSLCVPGGGFATVQIELPKAWDELTKELGYEPLNSFYLQTDMKPLDRKLDPRREAYRQQQQRRPQGGNIPSNYRRNP